MRARISQKRIWNSCRIFYGYAIIGSTYKWIESGMQADFEHFIARISESIDATLPVMISKAKANSN